MVDGRIQSFGWIPVSPSRSIETCVHRCVKGRLGSPSRLPRDIWPVGRTQEGMAHQPTGVGCRFPSSPPLGIPGCRFCGVSLNGQHHCGGLHQQTGRNQVPLPMQASHCPATLVSLSPDITSGQAHTGLPKRARRSIVQKGPDPPHGVVSVPQDFQVDLQGLGSPSGRPVRHSVEQQTPIIRVSHPRSNRLVCGRSDNLLGRDASICLSPDPGHTQSSVEAPREPMRANPNSTILARQGVVPRAPGSPDQTPIEPSRPLGPAETAPLGQIPPEPQQAGPSRVVSVQQSLKKKGFSSAVSSRMARPNRASTLGVYQSKWNVFSNWCNKQKVDPLTASAPVVADFLLAKFNEGLASSTLAGYRTAIACTLALSSCIDLGKDSSLTALLHNFEVETSF